MRIKRKLRQNRRDFTAIYECEHCGHTLERDGYDDAYFHESVIPAMTCKSCGQAGGVPTSSPDVPAGVTL